MAQKRRVLYLLFIIALVLSLFSCKNTFVNVYVMGLLDDSGNADPYPIEGKVGSALNTEGHFTLVVENAKFPEYKKGYDVSSWFDNRVDGLLYEIETDIVSPFNEARIHIYGIPLEKERMILLL